MPNSHAETDRLNAVALIPVKADIEGNINVSHVYHAWHYILYIYTRMLKYVFILSAYMYMGCREGGCSQKSLSA